MENLPLATTSVAVLFRGMNTVMKVALVLSSVVAVGCGDDGGETQPNDARTIDMPSVGIDAPPGAFQVSGTVTGTGPADGNAIVVWVVSSGSPDYVYKFGQGPSTPTTFTVSLASNPPPAQALNTGGIGVGIVVVLAPGTAIPADGMIDENVLDGAGVSNQHSIIYKAQGANLGVPWMDAMPAGYSCGMCVPAAGTFDTFVETQCTNVQVQWGAALDPCNWT